MTLPEVLLWRVLRERPGGLKFRRQHPAGAYVLDFFCAEVRLVIEVDGTAHDDPETVNKDAKREAWLTSHGVAVLRIPAREILNDVHVVAEGIVAAAVLRQPLHRPWDGPPPRAGEDF